MKERKTGLFFGSFNPIHVGHLVIANYILEYSDLNHLWFVVTPQNPLKKKSSLLPDHHRLYLTELAVGDHPKYKVSDIEFKLAKPSYTVTTLAHLSEKYPDRKFVLLMGTDNLSGLRKWKNFEVILENYEIYAYPRPNDDGGEFKEHPSVKIINAPQMEISSTLIRNSLKEGKDLSFLVPEKTWKYMREMHFYEK